MSADHIKQSDKAHFFLTSVATWLTTSPDQTLRDCVMQMEREGLRYAVWFIPHPHWADYDIGGFVPQIEGAVWVETIDPVRK